MLYQKNSTNAKNQSVVMKLVWLISQGISRFSQIHKK